MVARVIILCFFAGSMLKISAQGLDTIQSINGVEIVADKISVFSSGLKIEKIDSTILVLRQGISIATLLTEQSPVYLRSYGPGGISTFSMRGTNSSQSGVFWNGINLNQPNIGQTDLSRISTFEFSDISLQSGSASALLGSGIIGGSLHLSNAMRFSSPLQISALLTGATTANGSGGVKINMGSNKLAYNGSFAGDWNENKFWYSAFNGDRKQLDHALVKSFSSIHQAEYILNSRQRLTAGVWYQSTNRLVPPTMTMAFSDQHQWDQALRGVVTWSYLGQKQSFKISSAFVDEHEHFKSEISFIDSRYHLNSLQSEFEYKRFFNKLFTFGSGISGHFIRADVPYYDGISYQPQAALWVALAYHNSLTGIKIATNMRQDFAKGYRVPFCPSFNAEIPLSKRISTSYGVSRNFRVPSMNDLYWIPGGNPELKPENCWNFETGVALALKKSEYYQSKIGLSFYTLLIDNLIQWIPGNSTIWSPKNVQKVWSRGVEFSSKTNYKIPGLSGYFLLAYNFSPSTYRKNLVGESEILNKQLIYIPLHKVTETFFAAKGNLYFMCSYSLTGKRFVLSDNSKSLPDYSKIDLFVGSSCKIQKIKLRIQVEAHNVLNAEYQSVLYYPEPGRTFSLNVLISNK